MSIESKDSPLLHDGLSLFVDLFFICSAEQVVHGNIVEIRDFDENFGGNVMFAGFIIAVSPLGTVQIFCHGSLCQIPVLAEIPDSYKLHKHPTFLYYHFTKTF